ncbi:hypothetical protein AC626_13905, partial [Pseudoalteromonas rubra]
MSQMLEDDFWAKILHTHLTREDASKDNPDSNPYLPFPAQEIAIRKKLSIVLPALASSRKESKMQLQLEAIELGFILRTRHSMHLSVIPSKAHRYFRLFRHWWGQTRYGSHYIPISQSKFMMHTRSNS